MFFIRTFLCGASKMLEYFNKKIKPSSIRSYIDKRWNDSILYEDLGMKYIHETKPNYFYIINGIRYDRFNFRKESLIREGFNKYLTEHEIMLSRKIYRIYDIGSIKYKIIY